jgi:hypothetical protein
MMVSLVHTGIGYLVGDHGPGAGRDDDLVGGQLVAVVGAQLVPAVGQGRTESGVACEHLDVGGGAAVVLTAHRERIDAAEDPGDDVTPADGVDVCVDPVLC